MRSAGRREREFNARTRSATDHYRTPISFSGVARCAGVLRTGLFRSHLIRPVLRRAPAPPASEESLGHFLRGEREHEMVAPGAVDVQIARAQPFLAESEFLHDPAAGPVLGA